MEANLPAGKLPDYEVVHKMLRGIDDFNKTIHCSYFLVVLFSEGSGIHYIDGEEFPIGKNQLHFLFPGQHHHWVTGPETFAHKIIVGRKVFESFSSTDEFHFIRHNLNPVFRLSDPLFQVVNHEVESIERDLQFLKNDNSWNKIIQLRMDILASIMRREAESFIKENLLSKSNPTVKRFWNLISENYSRKKVPGWYAEQLAVTPNLPEYPMQEASKHHSHRYDSSENYAGSKSATEIFRQISKRNYV
ncbi:hypothetical protein [Pseudoflavitalea sp. G-6-1-2]|uniref:hypothetical protein n=1 Tax=Pseudoflavitalea sp. G-6-1-2 TaxID=2728841 RepID=UPI001F103C37|nr:hypothetical protein [Pseudoflavitalea sp. G-6-1-2]